MIWINKATCSLYPAIFFKFFRNCDLMFLYKNPSRNYAALTTSQVYII